MAKDKTVYVCDECGQESPKWIGKCPSCGAWNSFKQLHIAAGSSTGKATPFSQQPNGYKLLRDIQATEAPRINTGDNELDRVLGGGIVPGSLILLGGEPGIGKSTLVLQTAMQLGKRVLYVSGEESEHQLKLRADRLAEGMRQEPHGQMLVLCETSLEKIYEQTKCAAPDLVVIDSIQTIGTAEAESLPGSVAQIRACAVSLLRFSKDSGIPVVLIGHITKDGTLAGPKVLEHIVDTVLQFEGDRQNLYRILRSLKNRFGNTSEIGIYAGQRVATGEQPIGNAPFKRQRRTERDSRCSGHRRRAAVSHRNAGSCKFGGLWHTATVGHGIRYTTSQHAAGSAGKTRRFQTGTKRRFPEYCRRLARYRSGNRPFGHSGHTVKQLRHCSPGIYMHGRRSGAQRRNTSRQPHSTTG